MTQAKHRYSWLFVTLITIQSISLAQAPGTPDRKALAEQTLRLGFKGDYQQALDTIRLAQEAAEKNSDKASLAMATIDSVLIYFFQGNALKALQTYQKMLPISAIEGDKKALAHVLSRRAFLGYYRKGFAQAHKDAEQSLALFDPASDRVEIGFTLNVLGMIQGAMGKPLEALKSLQESLKVCKELEDDFWRAFPLNNIGYVYHTQGDDELALNHYHQSLAIIERHKIRSLLPYTLNNIGNAYQEQGAHTQALEYFQKSLPEREATGRKDEISTTLRDIGAAYRDIGDYEKSLAYYRKSLALEESLKNQSKISGRLHSIGGVYDLQQNFALAFDYFQKSLLAAQAADDQEGIASNYLTIGGIHLIQNNYDLALDYYQKALPASESSGHKTLTSTILQSLGTAYREKGDTDQALQYFQKSLKSAGAQLSKSTQAMALLNLGLTYYKQNHYDQALEYYQRGMGLIKVTGDRRILSAALNLIGTIHYHRGDYAETLRFVEQANALAKHLENPDQTAYSRTLGGRAFRALGQIEKARQAYDEAIAAMENARVQVVGNEREQQRFFETRVKAYYEMIALLIEQNRADEAFAYAERSKARTLLDVLHSGKTDVTKAMTAEEQEQERKLKGELISLNSQITRESLREKPEASRLNELDARVHKARLNYEAFQTNLYVAHYELKARRGEAQSITLDDTGALMPDARSALLEYVVTDETTYLFAITRGAQAGKPKVSLKVYTIDIKRQELTTRAEDFRQQLASRDIRFRASARQLYDLLLKPAQSQLQGKNHIVIVPDAALWELPFQALQPDASHYFIQSAAISYAPSLSALREMKGQRQSSGKSPTLLAFGNPAFSSETIERNRIARRDEKLQPLPETEQEVKALAELYGTENSRVYLGAAAREDLVKSEAGKFKVLHLATHGVLNDSNPMYSRIVLSQGETSEDGLLEAWEIMKLDLSAELVVLSACDTARGRIGAGEGVIGLTWAFFVAGSPTTVVSQWKVDSASTSQLMLNFHRTLKNAKPLMTKAEALRAASLKMLQSNAYKHPFYWAGFVIVGDAN
jgi:CHAT domain-containing protein/predicted negative regulator of RcsB-dependent stress response